MSRITVEMTAQEAGLWRAQQKIIDQQTKMERGYSRVGNEASRTGGKIRGAGREGEQAFGSRAISSLGGYLQGLVSIGAAVGLITKAFHEMAAARQEAAEKQRFGRMGVAALAQLAETPEEYEALVERSREVYRKGGGATWEQAAQLVFSLESARAGEFEQFFTELRASGLIEEPAVMAKSLRTVMTTMGEAETGTFRDMVSKALGASKFAPAYAQEIAEAAAKSGTAARELQITDEEVLAAAAILAEAKGGAEQGGTYLAQMFRTLKQKGEFVGMAVPDIIRQVRQEAGPTQADLAKWWGRAQGQEAWEVLVGNLELYEEAIETVRRSQEEDWAGRRMEFPRRIPSLAAAEMRDRATAAEELSRETIGTYENLAEAAFLDWQRQLREEGVGEAEITLRSWEAKAFRFIHPSQRPYLDRLRREGRLSDELKTQFERLEAEQQPTPLGSYFRTTEPRSIPEMLREAERQEVERPSQPRPSSYFRAAGPSITDMSREAHRQEAVYATNRIRLFREQAGWENPELDYGEPMLPPGVDLTRRPATAPAGLATPGAAEAIRVQVEGAREFGEAVQDFRQGARETVDELRSVTTELGRKVEAMDAGNELMPMGPRPGEER